MTVDLKNTVYRIADEDKDIVCPLFCVLQQFLQKEFPGCTEIQAHKLAQRFMNGYWLRSNIDRYPGRGT